MKNLHIRKYPKSAKKTAKIRFFAYFLINFHNIVLFLTIFNGFFVKKSTIQQIIGFK